MKRHHKERIDAHVPTVFLHGFSGDGYGLKPFADLYSGKGAICINMPGFGGSPEPKLGDCDDIYAYCDDVWAAIRREVASGPVKLVGHSHGAMIAYVLAVQHADDIVHLDLFCPVARPRLVPRLSVRFLRMLRGLGLSPGAIIRFVAHPVMVFLVTRYSFQREWTHETRRRIVKMREREAQYYSPVMFGLMEQTLRFADELNATQSTVPTRLCHVSDENIASDDDYVWYAKRTAVEYQKEITGGHLCIVADPARVVKLFETGKGSK
jgi:pimeloyl-ACP methyl ester carboxylesterase